MHSRDIYGASGSEREHGEKETAHSGQRAKAVCKIVLFLLSLFCFIFRDGFLFSVDSSENKLKYSC